jgi:uncharacterized protein (TIGR02996 family)
VTTGDKLFSALLADPSDADARTVYAEWLEENGLPETAAWWRGEEAAMLMPWLRAVRDLDGDIRKRRLTPHPLTVLMYDPDAAPVLRDDSIPGRDIL